MDFESLDHIQAAVRQLRTNLTNSYNSGTSTEQQARTLKDLPPKGPVWVSKFGIPLHENDNSRDALLRVIDDTNERNVHYDHPASEALHLEWTGYRKGVDQHAPEPLISEQEKYSHLIKESTRDVVIFFIYGGSFW